MSEYDRTDRKTCNKSITFLLVWLRIYPEYHQIQVKNEILTETTILQKWMDWNIFGKLGCQTTDAWSGIGLAPLLGAI